MVSRETIVHAAAVVLAFAVLFAAEYADVVPENGPAPVWMALLFYGFVLGGGHLYLAVRGEDGSVPVESRWRYVGTLAVLLVAGATISYGGNRTVVGVELESIGTAVLVVAVVGYLLVEAVDGYRASRPE